MGNTQCTEIQRSINLHECCTCAIDKEDNHNLEIDKCEQVFSKISIPFQNIDVEKYIIELNDLDI